MIIESLYAALLHDRSAPIEWEKVHFPYDAWTQEEEAQEVFDDFSQWPSTRMLGRAAWSERIVLHADFGCLIPEKALD